MRDEYGRGGIPWFGIGASIVFASAASAGAFYGLTYRVLENEVVVETNNGRIIEVRNTPGRELINPFIGQINRYSLGLQFADYQGSFTNADYFAFDATLKTTYQLDAEDTESIEDLHRLLTNLRTQDDMSVDDIVNYYVNSAAKDVVENSTEIKFQGNEEIKAQIMTLAQEKLDDIGLGTIRINGVEFENYQPGERTQEFLDSIAAERARARRIEAEEANARLRESAEVAKAEADAAYVRRMEEAGVDPDVALCIKKAEDAGTSNAPGSPGCIPGTGANALTNG